MARGVTTEWEDVQVRMGNWKPVEREPTAEEIFQCESEKLEYYDNKKFMSAAQLQEVADEDLDFDDEDEWYKDFKAKRMAELKEKAGVPRFGSVFEITKPQFEEHVTNAPKGSYVVIHMYQD